MTWYTRLHSWLGQIDFQCDLFTHKYIRISCFVKQRFQLIQLGSRKCGPFTALLTMIRFKERWKRNLTHSLLSSVICKVTWKMHFVCVIMWNLYSNFGSVSHFFSQFVQHQACKILEKWSILMQFSCRPHGLTHDVCAIGAPGWKLTHLYKTNDLIKQFSLTWCLPYAAWCLRCKYYICVQFIFTFWLSQNQQTNRT